MTLNEYYLKSEELVKTYTQLGIEEYRRLNTELGLKFCQEYKTFELNKEFMTVIARSSVFYNNDQKLDVVIYLWSKIKDSPDFDLQQMVASIIYVISNSLDQELVTRSLQIKRKEYLRRYSSRFVDLINLYGTN